MRHILSGLLVLSALGCGSHEAVREDQLLQHPPDGKVALVIMRTGHHHALQARAPRTAVFRITPDGQEFIGNINLGEKVTYMSAPGDQLFMVIGGENADFMQAHLDAGKTYYAVIEPRMGILRPRYSLFPVRKDPDEKYSMAWGAFADCVATCVERDAAENEQWYEANKPSVDRKREAFMRRWDSRGDEYKERKIMNPEDGV